jgi:hypothetical protein
MLDRLVVHIGLHKTGTTWLQRHAFVPAFGVQQLVDSAQPWDDSALQSLVLGLKFDPLAVRAELERRWDGSSLPALSAERLGGHPISGGYDRWDIADRLAEALPGARILVGTRSEGWEESIYAQMIQEGFTGRSLVQPSRTQWKSASWPGCYRDVGGLVEGYRQRFGRDRVAELPYELLRDKPEQFTKLLAEVCTHEALRGATVAAEHRENPRAPDLERLRLANHFKVSALNPSPLVDLGPRGAAWLARILKPF